MRGVAAPPTGPKSIPNGLNTLLEGTKMLAVGSYKLRTGEGAKAPLLSWLEKRNCPNNCASFPCKSYSPLANTCLRSCDWIECVPNRVVFSKVAEPRPTRGSRVGTYGPKPLPVGST